jgi:DNA-binding MarR family transcriptional regulator
MNTKRKTEKCFCIGFRRAARAVTVYYDRILFSSGLTINQYSLLVNLYKIAPCSTTSLAKKIKLERTTLIRTIKPLVDAGLIQDLSEAGKRNRQLTVTRTGLATLKAARKLWEKAQTGLVKYVGKAELKKLMNTMAQLEQLALG